MRNACVKERDQEPWMEKCGWNNGRQRQGQRESERESECVKMFKKKIRRSTSLLYFFFSSSSSHLVLDRRVRRGSGKASLRLSLRGGRWSAGRRGPTTPPGKERPALAACSLLTLAPLRTLPTLLPTLHAHRNRRRTAVLAAGRLPERSGVLRRPVLAAPPLHWGDRHPRRRRRLRRQLRAARAVCVGVLAAAHAAVARRHARHDEAAAGARGGRLRRSAARPRSLLVGHQGNLRALRLTRLLRRSPRLQNPPPLPALHSFAALHPELARKVRAVGSGVGVSTRVVSNFDALLVGHGAVVVCCVCVVLGLPAAAPAREEAALQPPLPPLAVLHALAALHACSVEVPIEVVVVFATALHPLSALHAFAALHALHACSVEVPSEVVVFDSISGSRGVSNFDALLVGHGAVVDCCVLGSCVVLGLPAAAPAREEAALQPPLPPLAVLHALAALHACSVEVPIEVVVVFATALHPLSALHAFAALHALHACSVEVPSEVVVFDSISGSRGVSNFDAL
eukprot:Rhum_TRINITY_DN11682_c0_g1::Rhum_TRINITY_DN11682_c0_g1_i10::g.46278::m.46278